MLLLDEANPEGPFRDDRDPTLWHVLPVAMLPAGDPPDITLMQYRSSAGEQRGGLLRVRLEGVWPEQGEGQRAGRPMLFEGGRFRLRVRTELDGDPVDGLWQPARTHGPELVDVLVSLTDEEAQLAAALTAGGEEVVEIEAELSYVGLRPTAPWLVRARASELRGLLASSTEGPSFDWDTLVNALRSVPTGEDGPVRFERLDDDGVQPDHDRLLVELASRAEGELWASDGDAYRWVTASEDDGEPEELLWDLRTRVLGSATVRRTFSLTDWYAELTDEQQALHAPIIADTAPFQPATLHVINAVPVGSGPIASVTVDLRYPGPRGMTEELRASFPTDNGGSTWRKQVIRQSMTPFVVHSRVTHVVAGPDGPIITRGPWTHEDGLVVAVDPARLALRLIRVSAEPALFEEAGSIALTAWAPSPPIDPLPDEDPAIEDPMFILPVPDAWTGTLTAEQPETWVSFARNEEPYLLAEAHLPEGVEGEPVTLHDGPVEGDVVEIPAHRLQPLEAVEITFARSESATALPWLAVALAPAGAPDDDEGELLSVGPGEVATFHLYPPSVFRGPSYRYQVRWLALAEDGAALPMVQSDWIESDAVHHDVAPIVGD